MSLLKGDWDGAWNAIKGTAETVMNSIISFFQGINLYEVGKSIITGLINGIKSMGGAILGAIGDLVPGPVKGVISSILPEFFADGGIVSSPTLAWVGEGGDTETVIPWNNSQRSKDLWMQTGKAIGMFGDDLGNIDPSAGADEGGSSPFDIPTSNITTNQNNSGGVIIQLTNKPTVIIQGDADPGQVEKELKRCKCQVIRGS